MPRRRGDGALTLDPDQDEYEMKVSPTDPRLMEGEAFECKQFFKSTGSAFGSVFLASDRSW